MLLRTLNAKKGLVNGSRLVVLQMTPKIIQARLMTEGPNQGKVFFIHRIPFHPKDRHIPFEMERRQYPVRISFGITANKSQGQTLKRIGINLTKEFFSHGQLYVALSRCGSQKNVLIFKPKDDPYPKLMKNVVFPEIL